MRRAGLSDTSPEAERVMAESYRRMTRSRKWALLGDLYRYGRQLHAAGVRSRRPEANPGDIRADWATIHLGKAFESGMEQEMVLEQPIENQAVVREVIAAFDALGIAYAIGGSLASSIHGYTRLTTDADITAEPFPGKESQLVSRFGSDYYVSLPAVKQAVQDRSTFNIINVSVGFKVDVFVRKDRGFEISMMRRRTSFSEGSSTDQTLYVITAEDVILMKLEWYRMGGEISDRQWTDVLGVLKTQKGTLDDHYLNHWAADLGVTDLLEQARSDASS